MGATAADTQREIAHLRADMTRTLDELQQRLRGGLPGIVGGEARAAGHRTQAQVSDAAGDLTERVKENPAVASLVSTFAIAAAGYAVYSALEAWRDSRRPKARLKHRVEDLRGELEDRWDSIRQIAGRAGKRGVVVVVGGNSKDALRVLDREGKPLNDGEGTKRSDVLKNLLWAGLLAASMALASVLARRGAGALWKATLREAPPTER